jgi:TRAP-type C4-dicarboxylate transport system permease small subunit
MKILVDHLTRMLAWLGAAAVILMMLHVGADVTSKYLFAKPIAGTAEIVAGYYMEAVVFLPLALMEVRDQPIVAEILFNLVGPRFQRVLIPIAYLTSLAFYALLARYSWEVAVDAYRSGEYVVAYGNVIVWPSKFLLHVGLGGACIALAIKLFDYVRSSAIQSQATTSAIVRRSVVLPDPDGPRMVRKSPVARSKDTSSTARTPEYSIETLRTATAIGSTPSAAFVRAITIRSLPKRALPIESRLPGSFKRAGTT